MASLAIFFSQSDDDTYVDVIYQFIWAIFDILTIGAPYPIKFNISDIMWK